MIVARSMTGRDFADLAACFGPDPTADAESATWSQRYPGW